MSTVAVRRLGETDLAAYKQLRDASLAAHPDAFSSDASESRALGAAAYLGRLGLDRPEGGVFTLAAWQGDALVGAVSCERESRIKVRHTVHLTAMMVRREFAGQGVGRRLLEAALDTCRAADGVEQVTLSVTATNLPAVRLYESVGFVRYGSLPRAMRVDGGYVTKNQMVRVL